MLYVLEDQKHEDSGKEVIAALASLQDECKQPNSPLFQVVKDHLEQNATTREDGKTLSDLSIFKMLRDSRLEAALFALVCEHRKELAIAAGLMTPANK